MVRVVPERSRRRFGHRPVVRCGKPVISQGKRRVRRKGRELYEFDAYAPDAAALEEVFKGDAIDVFIDDGPHTVTAIIRTLNAIYPYLSDECVCFIEDNDKVHHNIAAQFPDFQVEPLGQLTILHRKQ